MHAYIAMRPVPGPAVPLKYNYLIQSAIYSALPPELAEHLHEQGYEAGGRRYKMFTFSRLLGRYVLDREARTISFSEKVTLVVSSPNIKFFHYLINNLLTRNHLRLGEARLAIEHVRFSEQVVEEETLVVRTLSPVVAYSTLLRPEGGKYTCYYQPGEKEFERIVSANLAKKYAAYHGQTAPEGLVQVRVLDRPRLHVMDYKGSVVKGYTGRLRLIGPRELLQIALDAGLGSKNAQGFGCVEKVAGRGENHMGGTVS
ncbi:MAG: CRISPR-associated endoribonuclease Cas6 [Desulfurispora sp.]|uniref:CRISPR-associated endoribonuclease Cas6 n=1 Tax=Desulfurispora sp. TaxID=3014275 RepID=UPI00404B64E0